MFDYLNPSLQIDDLFSKNLIIILLILMIKLSHQARKDNKTVGISQH